MAVIETQRQRDPHKSNGLECPSAVIKLSDLEINTLHPNKDAAGEDHPEITFM